MGNLFQKLMGSGSTVALFAAMSVVGAYAQTQNNPNDIEQVVVSASRITIAGYTQPTPVTVVGAAQLEANAYADIADSIRDLPAVGNSTSAENGTSNQTISGAPAGTSTINLRNLGILRTLVLFDGQRVVQSNITGGVDMSTVPTGLVTRVDVVNGGASASWGSDAVTGVVDLIINKNFTGIKANVEIGDNSADNYRESKAEMSWGTDIGSGRGHIILSGSYVNDPSTVYLGEMHWVNGTYLVANPAYTAGGNLPYLIHVNNVGQSQATPGGVIVSSPAGTSAPANALAGIQFVGAGQTAPFNFGTISGTQAYGGNVNFYTGQSPTVELADPLQTETLFAYGQYRLTDTILASLQLNYGNSYSQNTGQMASRNGNLTITANNAYLPASVAATMAADGITSFTMGTLDNNNVSLTNLTPAAAAQSLGIAVNNDYRQLMRGVFTLTGTIGNDWGWNTYYQHGEVRTWLRVINNTITTSVANAANAVIVTAANWGTSGLPIGTIACVSTLTAPTNGCQPLDVFGNNVASAGAIYYVNHFSTPGPSQYGNIDYENITLNEDVLSGSVQGTLPWQLPAGAPAVAFGAEYRKEGGVTATDPRNCEPPNTPVACGGGSTAWSSGNFRNFSGQYSVEEGFLEVDTPIIKNGGDLVQSLDTQLGGRITSYSTSGLVETWKAGADSQLNDDVKLRAIWSYDIRAPDLSELFSAGQINQGSEIDPKTGKSVTAFTDAVGNSNLQPEKSAYLSAGVVLTPTFFPGFQMSLDWYSIDIHGYVYTLGATTEVSECAAGVAAYCADLQYNGTNYPGALGTVITQPQNAATETESGFDLEANYTMDLFSGNLTWHLIGNYTDELTLTAPGLPAGSYDSAGSLGGNSLVGGNPKLKATLSATYSEGPWSGTIQTRMEGAAVLNNNWVSGVSVDNNDVPFNAYLDLRASYRWNDNIQFYGAVDNTLNTPPPAVPEAAVAGLNASAAPAAGNAYSASETRTDLYDALGRQFRVGIRFSY